MVQPEVCDDAEAAAAFGDGHGEKARNPGEQSPPGEQRGGVHGGADEHVAAEGAAKELADGDARACAPAVQASGSCRRALQPEGDKGRRDAGEEDGAPSEVRHDDGDHSSTQRVADGPGALHQRQRLGAMLRQARFPRPEQRRRPTRRPCPGRAGRGRPSAARPSA